MKLKQNKQSKLVIALSAVILLLVALSATLTFAYFTASATQQNGSSVNFGELKISVTPDGSTIGSLTYTDGAVVPGSTVTLGNNAVITVEQGSIDCYVRFKLDVTTTKDNKYSSESAELVYDITYPKENNKDVWAVVTTTENQKEVTYVYYAESVSAKDSAKKLDLKDVAMVIDAARNGDVWQNGTITVKLTAEAIQADHIDITFGTEDTTAQKKAEAISKSKAWTANKGVVNQNSGN